MATWSFVAAWFAATVFNLWVGVSHAGYSVREELPILLLLFAVAHLAHDLTFLRKSNGRHTG